MYQWQGISGRLQSLCGMYGLHYTCKHEAIGLSIEFEKRLEGQTTENAAQRTGSKQIDTAARHNFLMTTALVTATTTLRAQEKKVDGGLAVITDKKISDRATPIVPPKAQSLRNMVTHCTTCQLCVSVYPNDVLCPSTDLKTLMQSAAPYKRGYCRPESTKCSRSTLWEPS